MSLATALCLVEDHNKNPFEYVCLHKQCKLPHMACAKCLVKIHKNHLNDCVELKDVQEKAKKINQDQFKGKINRDEKSKEIEAQFDKLKIELNLRIDEAKKATMLKFKESIIDLMDSNKQFVQNLLIGDLSKYEKLEIQEKFKQIDNSEIMFKDIAMKQQYVLKEIKDDQDKLFQKVKDIFDQTKSGVITYANGARYEGEIVKGKAEGKGIKYWPDGSKYEGECKNGVADGKGVYYWNDGHRYEGEWKKDRAEGRGVYYFCDGESQYGLFHEDKPIGKHVYYSKDNQIIKIKSYDNQGQFVNEKKYRESWLW